MVSSPSHQHALGQLQGQQLRRDPAALHGPAHRVPDGAALELRHGDVDRHRQAGQALLMPGGDLCARRPQDPLADLDDEPGLLGDGDELVGREDAELRMAPAQQRLGAGDLAAGDLHFRLVEQHELALRRSPCACCPSSVRRSAACAFISSEKNVQVLRPRCLAWYIATSAFLSRASASWPSPGDTAMPMLALMHSLCPSTSNGSDSAFWTRLAMAVASSTLVRLCRSGSSAANPLPPMRENATAALAAGRMRRL